jgi:rubrerythrin
MGITFNADEIFAMAVEIERNGAKFYRKAAENAGDDSIKQTLLRFASMEDAHEATFASMVNQIRQESAKVTYDPDGVAEAYLQAIADSRGWEGKGTPDDELTGSESIEEIINSALRAEKESVAFYAGLKEIVPSEEGKLQVEAIIREEMTHVAQLTNMLADLYFE